MTAPADGVLSVNTSSSQFDAVLELYTPSLDRVGFFDDCRWNGVLSREPCLFTGVRVGEAYALRVAGFNAKAVSLRWGLLLLRGARNRGGGGHMVGHEHTYQYRMS